jgi:hypothetical protein
VESFEGIENSVLHVLPESYLGNSTMAQGHVRGQAQEAAQLGALLPGPPRDTQPAACAAGQLDATLNLAQPV